MAVDFGAKDRGTFSKVWTENFKPFFSQVLIFVKVVVLMCITVCKVVVWCKCEGSYPSNSCLLELLADSA